MNMSAQLPEPSNECKFQDDKDERGETQSWGYVPNVHMNAVPMEDLRRHERYQALPPVSLLGVCSSLQSATFVRQDSKLWDEMHDGVITSRNLLDALGFRERSAGKRLGLPKHETGHRRLLEVFNCLQNATNQSDRPCEKMNEADGADNEELIHLTRRYNVEFKSGEMQPCSSESQAECSSLNQSSDMDFEPSTLETRHVKSSKRPNTNRKRSAKKRRNGSSATTIVRNDLRNEGQSSSKTEKFNLSALSIRGISAVRCAWGTIQEPRTLLSILQAFNGSGMAEVGLCLVGPHQLPQDLRHLRLPRLGASPDGVLHHPMEAMDPSHQIQRHGHVPWSCDCPEGTSCVSEVVEVKNTCPFQERVSSTQRKSRRPVYSLSCRPPPNRLFPKHIPQAQLEMLATGTESALIVLASAEQGMNIFRLKRSDVFIQNMLQTLSLFYTRYVLPNKPPPEDMFITEPWYRTFVQETVTLRDQATSFGCFNCVKFCNSAYNRGNCPFVDDSHQT